MTSLRLTRVIAFGLIFFVFHEFLHAEDFNEIVSRFLFLILVTAVGLWAIKQAEEFEYEDDDAEDDEWL